MTSTFDDTACGAALNRGARVTAIDPGLPTVGAVVHKHRTTTIRPAHRPTTLDPMSGGTHSPQGDTRSDEQLLAAHTHGDPTAFTTLITRHHTYLWNVALRTTRDPDDAADALQEALLSAHRTAGSFRAEARVSSWLHRIVVNASLDRLRRNAARRTVPLPEFDTAILTDHTDDYQRVDLTETISRALDELPSGQRAAVLALDVEGYSISEAAQLLGVPEGTIKSRSSRGRLRLAKLLGHLRHESLQDESE